MAFSKDQWRAVPHLFGLAVGRGNRAGIKMAASDPTRAFRSPVPIRQMRTGRRWRCVARPCRASGAEGHYRGKGASSRSRRCPPAPRRLGVGAEDSHRLAGLPQQGLFAFGCRRSDRNPARFARRADPAPGHQPSATSGCRLFIGIRSGAAMARNFALNPGPANGKTSRRVWRGSAIFILRFRLNRDGFSPVPARGPHPPGPARLRRPAPPRPPRRGP